MTPGGAEGAAAAAAIANAIKASGAIVRVSPQDFLAILSRTQAPLVVAAPGGLFQGKFNYLTSYKGLAFFCKSPEALMLGGNVEVVQAGKIWIPG
jgi:hypothetical protein